MLNIRFVWGMLLASLLASTQVGANVPKKDLQAKKQALSKELKAVENHIQAAKKNLTAEEKTLNGLDLKIQAALLENAKITKEVKETQSQLESLKAENERLSKTKAQHIKTLEYYLKAQVEENPSLLKMMLERKDNSETLNTLYQYVSKAQAEKMKTIFVELKKISENEKALLAQQEKLSALKTDISRNHATLNFQRKAQLSAIQQYQKSLNTNQSRQESLLQEQASLDALLIELEKALRKKQKNTAEGFAKMVGKLPLPIAGTNVALKSSKTSLNHKKTFIQAEEGTKVQAIYAGRVVFSEWLKGIGLLLIVDHGQGFMSLYGNNEVLYKSAGDWVNAEEVIARVGRSGGQANAGLYFELRKDGRPLDPSKWIQT